MLQQLCCFRERQLFIYLVSPTWGSWAASSAPHGARALLAHPSSASGSCRRVTQLPLPTAPPITHTHTPKAPLPQPPRAASIYSALHNRGDARRVAAAPFVAAGRSRPTLRGPGGALPAPRSQLTLSSPLPACPPQTQPTPAATTSGRRPPGPRCTPRPRTSSSWRGC